MYHRCKSDVCKTNKAVRRAATGALERLEPRTLLSASLIKDINPVPIGSDPYGFVNLNGIAIFAATDVDHGTELWRSDGTAAGTFLVKDINPGPAGSGGALNNGGPSDLIALNGAVYFSANGANDTAGLWRTNGTAAGTTEIASFTDAGDQVSEVTAAGNEIYFVAGTDTATSSPAVWVSDGTPAGTHMVTAGLANSAQADPRGLVADGSEVFFYAQAPGGSGAESLYRTDGAPGGATLVRTLGGFVQTSGLGVFGGHVYFADADGAGGTALFATDAAGDPAVPVTPAGVQFAPDPAQPAVVPFGGQAYFDAQGPSGFGLWRTDGTPGGATLAVAVAPSLLTVSGGGLYFRGAPATNPNGPAELYRTNGTATGTAQLTSIAPRGAQPTQLTDVNGTLFFTASAAGNGVSDVELWASNGTPATTRQVRQIYQGTASVAGARPGSLASVNGTLFFSADDGIHGDELWKSDGTAAGTALVRQINQATASSNPGSAANVNGTLYFAASDGSAGAELWKSDGTAAGTTRVAVIDPAAGASEPFDLTSAGGTLYFVDNLSTNSRAPDYRLFRSDGTPGGTTPIASLSLQMGGVGKYFDPNFTVVGGTLYFRQFDPTGTTWQLWQVGAGAPPTLVANLPAGGVSDALLSIGNTLLVDALSPSNAGSSTLYALSGGSNFVALGAGPYLRPDGNPGSFNSAPAADVLNGALYYIAGVPTGDGSGAVQPALYRTDGTVAGTVAVRIFAGDQFTTPGDAQSGYPGDGTQLYADNGRLLFNLASGVWTSDGTAGGTARLNAGLQLDGAPASLGGATYFIADATGAQDAKQLWRTDGTAGGTTAVYTNVAGLSHTTPLVAFNGLLYFTAYSEQQLWQSDGTTEGTHPVGGIGYSTVSPNDTWIVGATGSSLFFSPSDPAHGNELWAISSGTATGSGGSTTGGAGGSTGTGGNGTGSGGTGGGGGGGTVGQGTGNGGAGSGAGGTVTPAQQVALDRAAVKSAQQSRAQQLKLARSALQSARRAYAVALRALRSAQRAARRAHEPPTTVDPSLTAAVNQALADLNADRSSLATMQRTDFTGVATLRTQLARDLATWRRSRRHV